MLRDHFTAISGTDTPVIELLAILADGRVSESRRLSAFVCATNKVKGYNRLARVYVVALRSADAYVRSMAANEILLRFRFGARHSISKQLLALLLRLLKRDQLPGVKTAFRRARAVLGDNSLLRSCRVSIANGSEPEQVEAVMLLSLLRTRAAILLGSRLWDADLAKHVRWKLAIVLGSAGRGEAERTLELQLAGNPTEIHVPTAFALANLGNTGGVVAVRKLLNERPLPPAIHVAQRLFTADRALKADQEIAQRLSGWIDQRMSRRHKRTK